MPDDTIRLNVNIPKLFYRQLKAYCESRGTTITLHVTRVLIRDMQQREQRRELRRTK